MDFKSLNLLILTPTMPSLAAFHVGPVWAPVGPSWAPVGPRSGLTGAHLGMLLGFLSSLEAEIITFLPKNAAILFFRLLRPSYRYFNVAPLPELIVRPQRPLIPKMVLLSPCNSNSVNRPHYNDLLQIGIYIYMTTLFKSYVFPLYRSLSSVAN